ncbi:ABC transporter substrate-binding protein [Actinoplanes couchii]|uniref:ABC transporter substrate-binding protein n=1 Tax=Actinoplanes couchii TaxID=403638 RepID=A0ABQ3XRL1_9ACTN|nr:ABC transporter substrate-binding protein [Actinoplanes couchii]MDR6319995.1 peptide/nickel transport system substrate-binding protein [Actinoplanes couchii]GID61035.1 ABC transporter substrate-binding protein [Actinoplanes couchii]
MRRTAVALAATLILTGCGANDPKAAEGGDSGGKGGKLTILSASTDINFDPAKSQNLAITTLGLVLRRLTTWDIQAGKEATVVPDLATDTGTSSDGGKTWTYTLKDGLFYPDGSPITTADVKYGLERSFAAELSGGLGYHKGLLVGGGDYKGPYTGGELASIETPDAKTIVFKLNAPYGDWPWIASMPAFAPVPKAKDDPKTYTQNPVASGPYQVASYQQGTSVVLKRNPKWDAATDTVRAAGPDEVVFQLGQDATVAAQRLIADSGDDKFAFGAGFVPPAQLVQIESNASAKQRLVTSDAGALAYLAINTQRGPLKDVKVRQALQYAVDKKAFQVASGGAVGGDIATTLITPGIAGRQEYDLYPADPSGDAEKAKQLLTEAGQSKLSLVLLSENDPQSLAQAQAIQQGIQRAGITVTIKPADENTVIEQTTGDKPDYDLAISSWQPDFPSANGNIQPLFGTSEIGGGGYNISRYSVPEVDTLIGQALGETDAAKAQALWAQADKRILQDAPVVPLIYTKNSFLHGSNVKDFFVAAFPAYPNYLKVTLSN